MVENGKEPTTNIEKVAYELKLARELVGGLAAPFNLITKENFPNLFECAPESLEILCGFAEKNFRSDSHKLELVENMPDEVRTWPNDGEKAFLYAAAELGLLEEAFNLIKKNYRDDIDAGKVRTQAKDRRVGFGI